MKWLLTTFLILTAIHLLSAQNSTFQKIDKHALKTPKSVEKNINTLANFLVKETYSDLEIVRSFYTWITHRISYDYDAANNIEKHKRKDISTILNRKKAICIEYAALFKSLCALKNIESVIVSGYSKGTLTASPKLAAPDHAWNAVKIDDSWYLLDATWGSSAVSGKSDFSIQYNTDYFLTDPKLLIINHLPADPMWQLLNFPISTEVFQKNASEIITALELQHETSFNYKDSIQQYLALQPIEQLLKRATNEYLYNSTPQLAKEYGHALLDYGAYLSDIAESLQDTEHSDSLLQLQEQTVAICEKATKYAILFPNQQENCAYNRFNYAIALYQSIDANTEASQKAIIIKKVLQHLEQAEKELKQLPSNFLIEQAIAQCRQYIAYLKE